MNESELVDRARQGDQSAFGELVRQHQDAVFRAALAALGSAEDAEEIAQDAFVAAYSNLDGFREEASFRTWVVAIAWRRALTRRRRLAYQVRRLVQWTDWNWNMLPGGEPSSEAQLAGAELGERVQRLIQALPPKLRDALVMTIGTDSNYREVAGILDIPVGTLKWRVSEARRQIKAKLSRLGYRDD
ncbi:MAG: sigma-70 family RNA polymerase sigma factor [Vicinamibacterales bacterium]|nr:sigma-70 family RNA polymerase sigma factor [Vicinamibacterales bacterium]MDP6609090.1 sigma-70 family RNA polymerase sigma factor [Vicinamibacterales bacterium]